MAYLPLSRKYRPQTFDDLVGQEAVAKALAGAIRLGREPHALIFSGVRGIGKTTTARLYAKALDCEKGPTSEPCNSCASCQAITEGRHEDVIEIDGASNNGVAEVRALQETVEYAPQRSKFKVYIIDEVHMLSTAAFNALLKTLEEPPAHVVFVFATTELHKVPQTIVSRCPTFFLKKMTLATIRDRLAWVLDKEEIPYEDKALGVVAREGHGSMRDALTLLEQAIALGDGGVTRDSLGQIVSNLSSSPYLDVLEAAVKRDGHGVLNGIETLDQGGAEFADVCEEVARLARHGFVVKDLGAEALDTALLGLDDDELARLRDIAGIAEPFGLNRLFRSLVHCRGELGGGSLDRFIFENVLLEWCFDPGLPDVKALMEGLGSQAPGSTSPSSQGRATKSVASTPVAPSQERRRKLAELKSSVGEKKNSQNTSESQESRFPGTWRELVDRWKRLKPLQARKLEEVHAVAYDQQCIRLVVDEGSFACKSLLDQNEAKAIEQQFQELFAFAGKLEILPKGSLGASVETPETLLETRTKEAAERRETLVQDTRNAPFTKEILAVLGGTIEDVKIHES